MRIYSDVQLIYEVIMKILKITMLILGILAFTTCGYNIVFAGLANQWFGFISGAFLIWLFFMLDKFVTKSE